MGSQAVAGSGPHLDEGKRLLMQKMTYKLGQSYLLRLPPGEDLLVGLYRVCREHNVEFGVFRVVGAVRNATLGHLDQKTGKVHRQLLETGQDLAECSGNISPQGDSFYLQAYAVLSDAEGHVSAGELLAAQVHVAEVFIQELRGKPLVRERDPETGLWLWPVL
jgi:predicted DNA-binding protein with PD1-like motif